MSVISSAQLLHDGVNAERVTLDGIGNVLGRWSNPTIAIDDRYKKVPTFLTDIESHANPKNKLIIRGGSTFKVMEAKLVAEDQLWLLRLRKE